MDLGSFDTAYFERFEALAATVAGGHIDQARNIVQSIARRGATDSSRRQNASLRLWTAVFARDSYTCRYCERRTIAPPILRIVSHLFPDLFLFHPNWKTSETDASYFILSTSADHIVPVTRGGSDSPENLVTACWMCNGMKSNFLLTELPNQTLKPAANNAWRGLTEHLNTMTSAAGLTGDPYLRRWSEAIQYPEPIANEREPRQPLS